MASETPEEMEIFPPVPTGAPDAPDDDYIPPFTASSPPDNNNGGRTSATAAAEDTVQRAAGSARAAIIPQIHPHHPSMHPDSLPRPMAAADPLADAQESIFDDFYKHISVLPSHARDKMGRVKELELQQKTLHEETRVLQQQLSKAHAKQFAEKRAAGKTISLADYAEQDFIDINKLEAMKAKLLHMSKEKHEIILELYDEISTWCAEIDNRLEAETEPNKAKARRVTAANPAEAAASAAPAARGSAQPKKKGAARASKPAKQKKGAITFSPLELLPATGDDPLYCLCMQISEGFMIQCENQDCPYGEWFHYVCVGVKETPDGEWHCPGCSKDPLFKAACEAYNAKKAAMASAANAASLA